MDIFHFGHLQFLMGFHFGRLPFWSSSILVVFHFGRLPFWSSSILVLPSRTAQRSYPPAQLNGPILLHSLTVLSSRTAQRLPFGSSSIWVVFHFGRLPFRSSSI